VRGSTVPPWLTGPGFQRRGLLNVYVLNSEASERGATGLFRGVYSLKNNRLIPTQTFENFFVLLCSHKSFCPGEKIAGATHSDYELLNESLTTIRFSVVGATGACTTFMLCRLTFRVTAMVI
jgi:hypothetical protein